MEKIESVSLFGTLPPIKGISDTCLSQTRELLKYSKIDFIGFKAIYPEFLYPGGTKDKSGLFQIDKHHNLKIKNVLTWYNPISWIKAGLSVQSKIVHFHWWTSFLFPIFLTILLINRWRGKILLCEVHNVLGHESNHVDKLLNKIIFNLSSYCIVHSKRNQQQLEKYFAIDSQKIKVIPLGALNFFSCKKISKIQARKQLKISSNNKLVLCFGNMRKYKGIDVLINAFALVVKKIPDAKLLIAGKNWFNWAPFQQLIKKCHLEKNIITHLKFISFSRTNIYFTAADLVVLPYLKFEAQSGPGRIALAFRKAMIVTRVGGLPELIKNKNCVVEPNNQKELAKAIVKILKNGKLQRQLEKDSGNLAKKYSWNKAAKETINLYMNVLNN